MLETEDESTPPSAGARRAIWVYIAVFCVLSVAGWIPELAGRMGTPMFDTGYSPLFHSGDRFDDSTAFSDLTDFRERMNSFSGPALLVGRAPFPYPPPAALIFAFFLRCFSDPVTAYITAFLLCMAGLGWMFVRIVRFDRERGALLLVASGLTFIFGYPGLFAGNRGNLEWVNFGLAALGLAAFAGRRYWACGVLLGLSVCMKPFPILFFLLLLWRRRYREAAAGIAVVAVVSLVSLYVLGPTVGVAAHSVFAGWGTYNEEYVTWIRPIPEARFYHSFEDGMKILMRIVLRDWSDGVNADMGDLPLAFLSGCMPAVALGVVAWIWVKFGRLPMLNRIFAISIGVVLLPYAASEYTLLLIYVPLGLLLATMSRGPAESLPGGDQLLRILVPCAILCAPLNLAGRFSGLIQMIVLIFLLVQTALVPMPSSLLDQEVEQQVRGAEV